MPEKSQEPMNLQPPAAPSGVPELADVNAVDEEERAQQELARKSLTNAELRELAKKNPPLPKWFDEEEEAPF
jgi:hypothetical protein